MSKNRFGVEVPEIQIPDYDGSYNKTVQEAIKQAKLEVIEKIKGLMRRNKVTHVGSRFYSVGLETDIENLERTITNEEFNL